MIYELRTYDLKLRALPEVIKRFGDSIEKRQTLSTMVAFWYTEIGPLNQIIHCWQYEDAAERSRVRSEAVKQDWWPPNIGEFILKQTVELFIPWDNSPLLTPGKHGPYYEMRSYLIQPGLMGQTKARWAIKLGERTARSPLAVVMEGDVGTASKLVHIWPYQSLDERIKIRNQAKADGVWPPKNEPGDTVEVLTQENKIMLPAPFSPMQ